VQDDRNTTIVRDIYAAFGRRDIAALLGHLDPNVVWKAVTGALPHVPTAGERHGTAAVGEFFRILGDTLTFDEFVPQQFIGAGDTVVVLGHYAATTRGQQKFASDWTMVFTLRDGLVTMFQEFTDSAAINAAFEPAGVSA